MDVVYGHCAGFDVQKKTVVAWCVTTGPKGEKQIEVRTFGTMTVDLLMASDWLISKQITKDRALTPDAMIGDRGASGPGAAGLLLQRLPGWPPGLDADAHRRLDRLCHPIHPISRRRV
jgi:hypothetical protein